MTSTRTRLVVAVATAALALSACTSETANDSAPTVSGNQSGTQEASPPSTQDAAPTQSAPPDVGTEEALEDVKLGAIRVDAKKGTPSAEVTIKNNSSKRSNYIVDLSLTTPDGKTQLDATVVSAEGVEPGKTAKKTAQFGTTQEIPEDAKLTVVGVSRIET